MASHRAVEKVLGTMKNLYELGKISIYGAALVLTFAMNCASGAIQLRRNIPE
jgi:hypothetical protein